jgi:hypothetical protein
MLSCACLSSGAKERERIAELVRTVTGWTADAEKLMARRGPERLTIDAAQALLDKADASSREF